MGCGEDINLWMFGGDLFTLDCDFFIGLVRNTQINGTKGPATNFANFTIALTDDTAGGLAMIVVIGHGDICFWVVMGFFMQLL